MDIDPYVVFYFYLNQRIKETEIELEECYRAIEEVQSYLTAQNVTYANFYFDYNKAWYNIGGLIFNNPRLCTYGRVYANGNKQDVCVFFSSSNTYINNVKAYFCAELFADRSKFRCTTADQSMGVVILTMVEIFITNLEVYILEI